MRDNINKVSQRGERLDALQDKTDNLAVSAQGFRRGANRVRKQMWWKDMKMRMCLIVGIIILLIIIIVPAGTYTTHIIINHLISRLTTTQTHAASPLPPWSILLSAPLTLFSRSQHYWLRQMRVHKTSPAAVYPHRDRLLGTDWIVDMARAARTHSILQTWQRLFASVGSTYWAHNVGAWIVMTNEPDNVKALLSTRFEAWPVGGVRQKVIVMALGPRGIFAVNGREWQHARAMIRPSFVRNQIADLECTRRHVDNFLRRIPRDGAAVDLQELLYMFTMDVSTDFMFGYSTRTLVKPSPDALAFTRSFDYALLSASYRSRLGWIAFLLPNRKLSQSVATCTRFIDRYVAEALAEQGKHRERPYVFMNEMLESGASHDYIRDQLLAMILGGRDTSASTMSSLFWVLARRRDVMVKLRREVDGLEGRRPTWEELKEMKYLNMILKETLRLWAPVVTNLRQASHDTVLPKGGGPDGQSPLFVPKGTGCRWSLHSLHRRKDVFGDDADEFCPERWETLRTTWEYLPFSGGPRICIGQQFALTQMAYLVTSVVQTLGDVRAVDEAEEMVQETPQLLHQIPTVLTTITPAPPLSSRQNPQPYFSISAINPATRPWFQPTTSTEASVPLFTVMPDMPVDNPITVNVYLSLSFWFCCFGGIALCLVAELINKMDRMVYLRTGRDPRRI
ncbi:hypothetical protein G7046_g8566 [Stylonectria norvegica]|nr:hypothetical protein G7046_g8566 [Stylonectria norvegica]